MAPAASAAARAFSASRGTRRGHSGYGAFAAWTTTSVPRAASTTDSLERRSRWTTSVPVGNPPVPDDGRTTARTWWPARRARRTTAPPMDPLAPRTTIRTPPRDAQPIDKADATRGEVAYVHDACTRPGYPREPGWAIRTRLGEADEVRTMGRNGIKLGPRATIFGRLVGGERGGHSDAHPEQHRVEGRAGERLRGHVDRGRRSRFRRSRRHLPGHGGDGEQREPPRAGGLADGGPESEHDDAERTDRVRGLRRGGGRLRYAADLLHRLARPSPGSERRELCGGVDRRGRRRGDRDRGGLALRPARDPGPRPGGLRVPRGPGSERIGRGTELGIRPTEGPELLRHGGLEEQREFEPRGLDPHDGVRGSVHRVRWRCPGRLLGGSPPANPREPLVQVLGRATGRPRNPPPPHLHLRAALSGPTFIFLIGWK